MDRKLTPLSLYRAAAGSQISKLVPGIQQIAGEERDTASRSCSLFAVDLAHKRVLWNNAKIDLAWWFTIQEITPEVVALQAYEESPLPQASGIYAVSASSGTLLWQRPMLEYLGTQNGYVYAARKSLLRSEYVKLNASNGNLAEALQEDELPQFERVTDDLLFPSAVSPEHIASGELEILLSTSLDVTEIRGTIEEYVLGDLLIASVYSRETNNAQSMLENRLKQELFIFERSTRLLLFRELLHSSAQYPVPGSYFLTNRLLIYVKESNELKAIDLS